MANANSRKVVLAALTGNALITVSKAVAALVTGSAAMLAEAVHSLADTGNQVLLMLGMRLSKRGPTETHHFGRSVERYFWAFVVSIMIFSVGGAFAIYEGAHRLLGHEAAEAGHEFHVWNYAVLGVSLLFEGYAFAVAYREFGKFRGKRGIVEALIATRDPTIPTVILEDFAAITGLLIAFAGILLADLTGWPAWDGIASLAIGVLLCGVALFLARETHSLILGESASREDQQLVQKAVDDIAGIERITQMLSLHRGPDDVLLALKVHFNRELNVADIEERVNQAEEAIRAQLPHMRHIFIEADAHYDVASDPARRALAAGP